MFWNDLKWVEFLERSEGIEFTKNEVKLILKWYKKILEKLGDILKWLY